MAAQPQLFVILGATGDLMQRKLLPALHHLFSGGEVGSDCVVLAVSRTRELDTAAFRTRAAKALEEAGITGLEDCWLQRRLFYFGTGSGPDFDRLAGHIAQLERESGLPGNRVFYLALPPRAFRAAIEGLGRGGLNRSRGWTRLVVEKPFGRDLASARQLNQLVHEHFREGQVFRIDHYLGKETVRNLLVFRFANAFFESLWNRDRVESIQITVAEDIGVGDRSGYYDRAGAVRDMVQNHLTQLLTLTAMEVPAAFEADAIRQEKVKVLRSIEPIQEEDVVLGQYGAGTVNGQSVPGYLQETGVADGSTTPTFAALRLDLANWRWQGVPFFLRTGKRLARRLTRIVVTFRCPPVSIFHPFDYCVIHSNALIITLQPDEGFDLRFEVKAPGDEVELRTQQLSFKYAEAFGPLPDAYETLLLDVMTGDQTLFVHAEEVEEAWRLYSPLLDAGLPVHTYPAGSWGPQPSEGILQARGNQWLNP